MERLFPAKQSVQFSVFKLGVNQGRAVFEILMKTCLGDLFLAGGGFIGCIVGLSPHAQSFFLLCKATASSFIRFSVYGVWERVRADARVLRTHGPGLGSHDCERSRGQSRETLQQLSHRFLFQQNSSSLSLPHTHR